MLSFQPFTFQSFSLHFLRRAATVFQIKACFDVLKILSRFLHELSARHERPSQISNLKARFFFFIIRLDCEY